MDRETKKKNKGKYGLLAEKLPKNWNILLMETNEKYNTPYYYDRLINIKSKLVAPTTEELEDISTILNKQ